MVSSRLLKILVAVSGGLALLVVGIFFVHRPHQEAPFAKGVDKAEKITLQEGSATVQLIREGSLWQVGKGSEDRYKADDDKVKSLLNALRSVQVEDAISDRPERASDFEVTPASGTRVTLATKSGARLGEGIFGKQAPDFAHIYFKFPDKPDVFLARGMIRGDLGSVDLNAWRNREIWNIPDNQIQNIEIEGPGFKTSLARSSDTWSSHGEKLDSAKVWALVGSLAHLRADDFVDLSKQPDLSASKLTYAHVIVQTTGETHEIYMGAADPKTQRYPFAVDKDSSVAWMADSKAKSILRKVSEFRVGKNK